MVSSKKSEKKKRIIVDIPRSLWELTKEDKAKLQRRFKAVIAEVRASAADGGDDEEGGLTPKVENT
jgi:hypothetical protein